ncbi:MAG: DUF302 domain-containing protein [Proteobacteria bacterium]|nr:DUF302 domain-containing protein [Pseudomonadota bacterium]
MFPRPQPGLALALALGASLLLALPAAADQGYPYPGMRLIASAKDFDRLVADTEAAIAANGMGLVTQASASAGAARRGIKISGNMVIGVFRNDFAVRVLAASVTAGIEAPLRLYLVENADGTATLAYRTPSAVFKPYGSPDLDEMAKELDVIFAAIAGAATR